MCRPSNDLALGDPLLDADEVARYCSPKHVDANHWPLATAFVRRPEDCDLSVDRLQSFIVQDRQQAVDCIRSEVEKRLTIRKSGRFAVINVGQAKHEAQKRGFPLRVVYTPEKGGPSHSSIFDLPDDHENEMRVATALMRLLTEDDIYPALTN